MKVNGLILLGFDWGNATEGSSQAYDESSILFTRSNLFKHLAVLPGNPSTK